MMFFVISSDWRERRCLKDKLQKASVTHVEGKTFAGLMHSVHSWHPEEPRTVIFGEKAEATPRNMAAVGHYRNVEVWIATGDCYQRVEDGYPVGKQMSMPWCSDSPKPGHGTGDLPDSPCDLIGSSKVMENVRMQLARLGGARIPTLLIGESGTGKAIAAQIYHKYARRSGKALVTADCGTLNNDLGRALLFGVRSGAYTGSTYDLEGLVAQADQSTLFLDEVENLGVSAQKELLTCIDTGIYRRVGEAKDRKSRFAIIGASNLPLEVLRSRKLLREDFFYRICSQVLYLPPLRSHAADIPEIVHFFLMQASDKRKVTEEGMQMLQKYPWPGNVRQLRHVLDVARLLNSSEKEIPIEKEYIARSQF